MSLTYMLEKYFENKYLNEDKINIDGRNVMGCKFTLYIV